MRALSPLPFLLLCMQSHVSRNHLYPFINPTGTYILKGTVKKNNITGHFGELRVNLLDSQTVAFCFYLSSGYPDYSTASMMDTLHYEDNRIHLQPNRDSTCSLVLTFGDRSVDLMTIYTDPGTSCGFAPGVIAPATLNKISSAVPVIQDFSTRRRSGDSK